MSIRITAVRLTGGQTHQHITRVWWTNPANGESRDNTRAEVVSWIEHENGKAYVDEDGCRVDVLVVTPASGPKFLRTYADGVWKDNLLALPRR